MFGYVGEHQCFESEASSNRKLVDDDEGVMDENLGD